MEGQVFDFNDQAALNVQCNDTCKCLFEDFVNIIKNDPFLETTVDDLCWEEYEVTWLAEYGCAVLVQEIDCMTNSILVVGLDGWKTRIHASVPAGRQVTAVPDLANPAIMEVGSIPADGVSDQVLQALKDKLKSTQRERSRQKNHKTPSFVWSKIIDVLVEENHISQMDREVMQECYQGGTTDVGKHTDCLARNTSFPLVASVYAAMLTLQGHDKHCFYQALSVYYLHHLKNITHKITTFDRRKIDRGITVIREIKECLSSVNSDEFYDNVVDQVEVCYKQFTALKPHVDPVITNLPEDLSIALGNDACQRTPFPHGNERTEPESGFIELYLRSVRARERAKQSLEWSEVDHYSFGSTNDTQQDWSGLGWMSPTFWQFARDLNNPKAHETVKNLGNWLNAYDHAISAVMVASKDCRHTMAVELRSLGMLTTWIVYCWAHRIATERYPVLLKYSAALDPKDLSHLVLREKEAIDASKQVRIFLENHRKSDKYPFRNREDTLNLALAVGMASEELQQKYREEHASATLQIVSRYNRIMCSQAQLRTLDSQLNVSKEILRRARKAQAVSEHRDCYYDEDHWGHQRKRYTREYYDCQRATEAAERKVTDLQQQIRVLEEKPPDLFLCLPRSYDKALQWLFFLYMPREFGDLVSLVHRGAAKLWAKLPAPDQDGDADLFEWFVEHKCELEDPVSPETMVLDTSSVMETSPLVRGIGIRGFEKETGVFFPDVYGIVPRWKDADPFASDRSSADTVRLFTETLPKEEGCGLQQYLAMSPSSTRGNQGIASKNRKPDWLTHEAFMMFTSLRAFPNLQIRHLLVAMVDNLLPFEKTCVHVIVRQLLFHVGEEKWKTDLESPGVLERIAEQLNRHADLLQESPNNADRLLLFGTVSSFFGQYHEGCLECSRRYTDICRSLADGMEQELRSYDKAPPSLYWKQAKLYACAVLCHSLADASQSSLLHMAELIFLFRQKKQFAGKVSGSSELDNPVQYLMGKKIRPIISAIEKKLDRLSKCLGLIVDDVSSDLAWTAVSYEDVASTACFESNDGKHHYSINVLNGRVLVDGVPPGFLPSSVLIDPLYQRTFGRRNFECIVVGESHFRSSKLVDGRCRYDFKVQGDSVCITEYEKSRHDRRLEKPSNRGSMCGREDSIPCVGRSDDSIDSGDSPQESTESTFQLRLVPRESFSLPALLLEPYSHWYSQSLDAAFVRGASYTNRDIHYVITREAIYRVRDDDVSLSATSIFENIGAYETLVEPSRLLALRILSRIEKAEYVLAWRSTDCQNIVFQLPRLELEFCQRDSGIASVNFKGFEMRRRQALDCCLPGIRSFLVLVDRHGNEKVLIPAGEVELHGNIHVPKGWVVKRQCHIFDVHRRFGHLIATDILARLQIAAVYAATGYSVADIQSKQTGEEIAMDLVRQCWTNEMLPEPVKAKLQEVSQLSTLSCSLHLMCAWIWKCSERLSFLREGWTPPEDQTSEFLLELDPLAVREYRQDGYHSRLLPSEERFLLGSRQKPAFDLDVMAPSTPTDEKFVDEVEKELAATLLVKTPSTKTKARFPLNFRKGKPNSLESHIHLDLKSSWNDLKSLSTTTVARDKDFCVEKLQLVSKRRVNAETSILTALSKCSSSKFRLCVMSGSVRSSSNLDIPRIALAESSFQQVNPFITAKDRMDLRVKAVEWMLLCVLEDKLCRLTETSNDHTVLEEVAAVRNWNPWSHIRWLVFEVDRRIQIRPYQYSVVRQLLENPCSMTQLNMGLGKTSVLVPMLILELSRRKECVVRINMLSSVIDVMKESYRLSLTASIQHVKIFSLPFQRNFDLAPASEKMISEEILRVKESGGCLLVTPQQRNSLLLKQYDSNTTVRGLENPFVDVIDESDAILHQSFQLVYALGDQEPLVDGQARWTVAETFLQILAGSNCQEISRVRQDPTLMHSEPSENGEFPRLRLLQKFKEQQKALGRALCRELLSNPPHLFLWMKQVVGAKRDELVALMTNANISALGLIESDPLFRKYKTDIIAARGCIAYGLLFHCLKARHRVNFGVDGQRKKMAVPFSASDTPKARADYSHPDVAIIYTCLSYFSAGLSLQQLRDALNRLKNLGPTAQETIYRSWIEDLASKQSSTNATDIARFDSHLKVDTENTAQIDLMYSYLGRSMKVVSFWMNNFVFPAETHVFPGRRVTSAWDLVSKGNSIGFSGTDDNRLLLPRYVQQRKQAVAELRATNAKMIDCILQRTRSVQVILGDDNLEEWKSVLHKCMELGTQALLDVGGLMAGVTNGDAATFLAKILDPAEFRGVVFFNRKFQCWCVLELKTGTNRSLQTSSVQASECFAFYDESRCRGHDLKLRLDTCALVTLEPRLTKDRFLQGCARLRQLQNGQSLILAGTTETLSDTSTAKDVLEMIIENTASQIQKGVIELFERGTNHFQFPKQQHVDVSLETLYAGEKSKYGSMSEYLDATVEVEGCKLEREEVDLIQHCRKLGAGITVEASQLSEECERELENEEEAEEEEEVDRLIAIPFAERDWNFDNAFPRAQWMTAPIFRVRDVIADLLGPPMSNVIWSDKLRCTANWRHTIETLGKGRFFLRPVNAFLALCDGSILLISDYEADKLLPYWWEHRGLNCEVKLCHLPLVVSKISLGCDEVTLSTEVRTAAKLFRGYVNYDAEEKKALKSMFVKAEVRATVLELLQLRHRLRFLERSDLDVLSLAIDEAANVGQMGSPSCSIASTQPFVLPKKTVPKKRVTIRAGLGPQAHPFAVTMVQDGVSTVAMHSISAMAEFESKSFEELRFEQYQPRQLAAHFVFPTSPVLNLLGKPQTTTAFESPKCVFRASASTQSSLSATSTKNMLSQSAPFVFGKAGLDSRPLTEHAGSMTEINETEVNFGLGTAPKKNSSGEGNRARKAVRFLEPKRCTTGDKERFVFGQTEREASASESDGAKRRGV
ncbi:Protein of unknown function (DUF3645) [Seminavis robusta]|uniref:ubiquitinyl hydrolase 1 n=1 Tax=Seminavis robusta TaxID=568900 RepID=A0A9N8E981_9STRA|nr:Protein of unknown function (DUF3645) [Seminavis robusta]|eukprot:Sro812_g206080.1 Protein of unknown function (DUF3645) (2924) ;mRNA; f:27687-36619